MRHRGGIDRRSSQKLGRVRLRSALEARPEAFLERVVTVNIAERWNKTKAAETTGFGSTKSLEPRVNLVE